MKLNTLSRKFHNLFHRKPEVQLSDAVVAQLVRSLQATHEQECACDEFHDFIDQFAETNIRGEDAACLMPLIRNHLEICHECCEEYEALLSILQAAVEKDKQGEGS